MAKKKNKWQSRVLACALAAALTAGTAVMTPVADFAGIPTSIVANAATTVSKSNQFLSAVKNGGEIVLGANISLNQSVTISKACTIDFNGKKITFNGNNVNLTVQAPTTLKNGTLTSSYTYDPRFFVLNVSSNTVVENMTISQPGNAGGHGIVYIGGSNARFTMKDSTITYLQNGKYTARGIEARSNAALLFYGENFINTVNNSSNWYDWNIIENCDCYFYPGTLEVNYHFAAYNSSSKVYFCGGAVKNTRSGDTVFSELSADKVILQNDGDDYALYSDENCTVPMTAANAVSASAIYSKLNTKTAEVDFSGLGDATITLTGRNSEDIPLSSNGKGTIIEGGKVTSSVPLKFTGAEVTETVNNNNYIYTIDSITGDTVTVKEGYIKEDTWWGLKKSGTLELFGTMPDDIEPTVYNGNRYYSPWGTEGYWSRSNIKKIVALPGAKAGKNSLYRLFFNHIEVTEIDLSNLDVSDAENMSGALQDCREATTINLSGWDTSKVTDMSYMFYQCSAIQSLDLSHFNTSKVTDMKYMFCDCGLKSLNISKWDTSNVTNMVAMFAQCYYLESTDNIIGWSGLNTSNVTNMQAMFNTSKFKKIDVSNFDTRKVENMSLMFSSCTALENIVGLDKFDTPSLTDTRSMFAWLTVRHYDDYTDEYLGSSTALKMVDLSSFNFSEDVNMNSMFASTDVESIKVNDTFVSTGEWGSGNNAVMLSHYATDTFIQGWYNEDGEMVSGTGYYAAISGQSGTLTRRKYDFTQATVSGISTDYVYTGEAIEPEFTVTYGDKTLTAGTDYKVTYINNTDVGVATVKIAGLGEYGGVITKKFVILPREMKASITNRRKIGNKAEVVLSSEWYLPKNAINIKAGIARLSTDDTNITKYDVYNNGVKKASTLKTTSGKYSFSLLMNSTHANQNLYAVTYVTYEIDGVPYVSISDMDYSPAPALS